MGPLAAFLQTRFQRLEIQQGKSGTIEIRIKSAPDRFTCIAKVELRGGYLVAYTTIFIAYSPRVKTYFSYLISDPAFDPNTLVTDLSVMLKSQPTDA